ncbi:PREDICTED: SH3 domain-binding protein 5-like, partial [Cariama cristata]|uniref:SH3 domain-binding protein 5-like n=1 Tax=Cariama cristata TaxID=54380 RepID=UPI0005201CD7
MFLAPRLQEARTTYRRILSESARKLNTQGSQLGNCIEKARPYYEARRLAKELCQQAEAKVQALQKSLKRVIVKSKPYFELKAQFNQILEEHKAKVTALERLVSQAKTRYSVALRNLEQISEQIHARRLQRLIVRRASPVGAEASPQHA